MGDINQYKWIESHKDRIRGPILEIGSKKYSNSTFMNYRKLFNNLDYTGIDLSEGENVDLIIDLTEDFNTIEKKINRKYNTIICCSVLEHVKDIFRFSTNLTKLLNPNGILLLSVPFTWEFHGYPNDYWRFTPASIQYLFPNLSFPINCRTISSHIDGHIKSIEDNPNTFAYVRLLGGTNQPTPNVSPITILRTIFQLIRKKRISHHGILYNSLKSTRLFYPSCINMIGIKND